MTKSGMLKKRFSPKKVRKLIRAGIKWILISVLIALFFSFPRTQVIGVVAAMVVFSFIMGLATRILQKSNIGLSFTKLLAMLLMYSYGIKIAIIAAPLMQMFEWIGQNYYKPSSVFILPNMMLMPIYGFWILNYNIAWAGFVLLLIANAIEIVGSSFIAKEPVKVWMYYITNAIFNFPIFWRIAPLLV